MRFLHQSLLVLVALAVPIHAQEKKEKPSVPTKVKIDAGDVRKAVQRSLPFIEREGLAWWKNRKCNGCHHGGYMLWAHNEARQRGFDVDDIKVEEWTTQALSFYLKDVKEMQTKKNGCVEGTSLVLGQAGRAAKGKTAESFKTVSEIVVLVQQGDGFWKYEGQGLKRSDPENNEATTLWSILALSPFDKMDAAIPKSRERALGWLKKAPLGESNEALVLRMLAEDQFGDRERAKKLLVDLKSQQNADGGWSWTKTRPSEAFATGQSLYGLARMGTSADDPAIRRAWAFLLEKQKEDGSWLSPTRKPTAKDNAIANFWGTAWATIGLVRTLPEKK